MKILVWRNVAAFAGLVSIAAACSDDKRVAPAPIEGGAGAGEGGAGGSAGPSAGGGGAAPEAPLEIAALSAPTETEVALRLRGDPELSPVLDARAYVITSPFGRAAVRSVAYDTQERTLVLTTAPQKLGVTYELAVAAPGTPLDGLKGTFLSADTATFAATDFSTGEYYDVIAERRGIGQHSVVYVQQGMTVTDVEDTIQKFDERIFPTETQLFTDAPDQDNNGKIVLLGLDGAQNYGGYVDGEQLPQGEVIYVNVATASSLQPERVVTHEMQHILHFKQHGIDSDYWSYHDEGLGECAKIAVWGENRYALDFITANTSGRLGAGESLVYWEGIYDQYAMAFLFWTYVAAQAGGVAGYHDIFELTGDPVEVDEFLSERLGQGFAATELQWLAATWVRAPTGRAGYASLITFPDTFRPPEAPAGATSLLLPAFSGSYFRLGVPSVDYPGTQGEGIVYAGIDGEGAVDFEAPFQVDGGALVVLNASLDAFEEPQPSGPDLPHIPASARRRAPGAGRDPAWLHPPPVGLGNREAFWAWKEATAPDR